MKSNNEVKVTSEEKLVRALTSLLASVRRNAPPALLLTIIADAREVQDVPAVAECIECVEVRTIDDRHTDAGWLRDEHAVAVRTSGRASGRNLETALAFLLTRIGSWTDARWDQHLRHEFGDELANVMIAALKKLSGLE